MSETVKVRRRETTPRQWIHKGVEIGPGEIVEVDRDQAKRLFAADIADPVSDAAPLGPPAENPPPAPKAKKASE